MRKIAVLSLLTVLLAVGTASAQADKEWWGHFGGSWVEPMGTTADKVDADWGLTGGVMFRPDGSNFGLMAELTWSDFDAPSVWAESDNGIDILLEGHAEVWSATLNGLYYIPSEGRTKFYLIGGAGAYKRNLEVTSPAGYDYVYWCDPWWGVCWADAIPVDAVLADDSQTKLGVNAGIGISIETGYNAEMYIESRYNWMDSSEKATEFLPITIGFRF